MHDFLLVHTLECQDEVGRDLGFGNVDPTKFSFPQTSADFKVIQAPRLCRSVQETVNVEMQMISERFDQDGDSDAGSPLITAIKSECCTTPRPPSFDLVSL